MLQQDKQLLNKGTLLPAQPVLVLSLWPCRCSRCCCSLCLHSQRPCVGPAKAVNRNCPPLDNLKKFSGRQQAGDLHRATLNPGTSVKQVALNLTSHDVLSGKKLLYRLHTEQCSTVLQANTTLADCSSSCAPLSASGGTHGGRGAVAFERGPSPTEFAL